jgi:hypothetical protein
MKYKFKLAFTLPKHPDLLKEIDAASNRLADKLSKIDILSLDISDYNKRYFGDIIKGITASLQLRSYILAWLLHEVKVPRKEIVFIDYGGGSGLLSLLAKEYGIGTVIYDDIYEVSCKDARTIARAIGNEAEHYVPADIDELIQFMKDQNLSATALGSYDVLEHIYNVESFLPKLNLLSQGPFHVFMGSGANPFNPLVNKVLIKKQIDFELNDRPNYWGSKDRDSLRSFLSIRREIISDYAILKGINFENSILDNLAKKTRGLIKEDIETQVDNFIKTGVFPKEIKHKTNTCDPYTGNWAEHLMNPYELSENLSKSGFKSKVLKGYYGDSNNKIKQIIGRGLNLIISLSGSLGLKFSAFYALYAIRTK